MGKPTGFMEYPRELPMAEAPAARVRHWQEFHAHADEAKLQVQGARCMDCGVPFCHTGDVIAGMASGFRFLTWQRNRKRSNSARSASSSGKWLDAENSDTSGNRWVSAPRR